MAFISVSELLLGHHTLILAPKTYLIVDEGREVFLSKSGEQLFLASGALAHEHSSIGALTPIIMRLSCFTASYIALVAALGAVSDCRGGLGEHGRLDNDFSFGPPLLSSRIQQKVLAVCCG